MSRDPMDGTWGTLPPRDGEVIRLPWRSPCHRYEIHRRTRVSPAGPTTYSWNDNQTGEHGERGMLSDAMDELCKYVARYAEAHPRKVRDWHGTWKTYSQPQP